MKLALLFSMKYFLVFFVGLIFLSSCTKESKTVHDHVIRETLNLNFNSNILNVIPDQAQTDSEKFVRELMFETLCEADSSSNVFSSISVSSDQTKYTFVIDTTRRYNNGLKVDSNALKKFFEEIVKTASYENKELVFNNILGFKNGVKELPQGINFVNDTNIEITLKKPFDIITAFSKEPFYLHDGGIGTGLYVNTIADDDILFTLERVKRIERGINYIQIRFIKNQEEMLDEFLAGKLDVLESKYMLTDSSKKVSDVINSIIEDKYDGFNVSYLKSGYIHYSSIYEMYDSLTLSKLSQELKLDSLCFVKNISSAVNNIIQNDSSYISSNEIQNILVKSKSYYYSSSIDYSDFIPELTRNKNTNGLKAVAVYSVIPDKYFYTNDISGLTNYQKLSDQIEKIRFKPIIQF